MDYEGDRPDASSSWTPICNQTAARDGRRLQPPTITHASATPNPREWRPAASPVNLGDDIEDVLSIRVGTVDARRLGTRTTARCSRRRARASEPQWVRGYVNVETALGGAGRAAPRSSRGWAPRSTGAADACCRVGDDAGRGGWVASSTCCRGRSYGGWGSRPQEIKTGDSFVTPFFAKTCEPGSAGCGWFVLPIGTPVFDTGQMLSKAPRRRAHRLQLPDLHAAGRRAAATSSCRRAPCTTTAASRPPAPPTCCTS